MEKEWQFLRVHTLKRRREVTDEVLLDRRTARRLRGYIRRTLAELLGRKANGLDPLFPARRTPKGIRAMTRQNASKLFRLYARRAGLGPHVVLHSLRHYRGTVLYATTRDPNFVKQQLRHRSLSSTLVYTHTAPKRLRRYLGALERGRT